MSTNTSKLRKAINAALREIVDREFKARFDCAIETDYNFLNMAVVSVRVDGKKFTKMQNEWLRGFSDGYAHAMDQVK